MTVTYLPITDTIATWWFLLAIFQNGLKIRLSKTSQLQQYPNFQTRSTDAICFEIQIND